MIFAYNGVIREKEGVFDDAVIQAAVWTMLRGTLFGRRSQASAGLFCGADEETGRLIRCNNMLKCPIWPS